MSKPTQTKLDVLFPDHVVQLTDGTEVTVHPLSLEDLPKVIQVFSKIIFAATDLKKPEGGTSDYSQLLVTAGVELAQLLPYCLNRPAKEISMLDVPEVIEIILEQNLNEVALGKWEALVRKIAGKLNIDLDKLLDQSKENLKKNLPNS